MRSLLRSCCLSSLSEDILWFYIRRLDDLLGLSPSGKSVRASAHASKNNISLVNFTSNIH